MSTAPSSTPPATAAPAGRPSPPPRYGGQAVIEGVMIRGVRHYSLAVRRPDGNIFCATEPVSARFSGRMRRMPLLRGVLILAETLWLGMKSLQRSALLAAEPPDADDAAEPDGGDAGSPAVSGWAMALTLVIAVAFGVGVFLLLPLLAARLLESFLPAALGGNLLVSNLLVINLIEGVIRLAILVGYVAGISALRDIRRVYAYHGAEHMAVHTYEAGQDLTPDNVRRHPTPHPRCGTAFLLTVAIVSVLAFALLDAVLGSELYWRILSRIVPIPVVAAVSYEIIRFAGAHPTAWFGRALAAPGLWLQRITTRPPDAGQIEVAIAAMRATIDADEQNPAA